VHDAHAHDDRHVSRCRRAVLIVVGATDSVAGDAQVLARAVRHAQVVVVPNRDHMQTLAKALQGKRARVSRDMKSPAVWRGLFNLRR